MDWGDLDKICRKKPKEIRSLTLRIPFSYNVELSSSRRTSKNHSSRIPVNNGVSKSSRRLIRVKRTGVNGRKGVPKCATLATSLSTSHTCKYTKSGVYASSASNSSKKYSSHRPTPSTQLSSVSGSMGVPKYTTPATSLSTNTAHVVTRDHSDASEIGDIREKKRFHIQLDSDEDSGEESVVRQAKVAKYVPATKHQCTSQDKPARDTFILPPTIKQSVAKAALVNSSGSPTSFTPSSAGMVDDGWVLSSYYTDQLADHHMDMYLTPGRKDHDALNRKLSCSTRVSSLTRVVKGGGRMNVKKNAPAKVSSALGGVSGASRLDPTQFSGLGLPAFECMDAASAVLSSAMLSRLHHEIKSIVSLPAGASSASRAMVNHQAANLASLNFTSPPFVKRKTDPSGSESALCVVKGSGCAPQKVAPKKKNIPAKVSSTTASGGKSRVGSGPRTCPLEVEELIIRLTTTAYEEMKTQTNSKGKPRKQLPKGTKANIEASAKARWIELRHDDKNLPVPACFGLDEPHAMRGKVKSTMSGIVNTLFLQHKPKLDGSKSSNHPDMLSATYHGLSPESKKHHNSKNNAFARDRNKQVQLGRAQIAAQLEDAEEEVFHAFSPEVYDRIKDAAEKNEVLHALLQTQLPKELFTAIGLEKLDESVLSEYDGKKIYFYFGTSQEHNLDRERLRFLLYPSFGGDDLDSCGSENFVLSIKKGSGMFEANKNNTTKKYCHILTRNQCIDDLGFKTIVLYKSPLEFAVRSGEDTLQYGTDHVPIASSESPVDGEPLIASRLWKKSGAGSNIGVGKFILFLTYAIIDPQEHPDLAFYTGKQNRSSTSLPEMMRKAKSMPLPSIPVINRVEKSSDFVEAAVDSSTFQDAIVCFSGKLPDMNTAEAVKAALSMGAEKASVYYTNETTLLVRGEQNMLKSGGILSAKEKRALNDETPVISADDFVELYESMEK